MVTNAVGSVAQQQEDACLRDARFARQRSRTYSHFASAFSKPQPGLEREFTRLFLGPGRPVVHPYESVHREGRMMGNAALQVRHFMTTEGLAAADNTPPDHVSIELAFMAYLAGCEASSWDVANRERAVCYRGRQADFLQDHLMRWLPQFCHRLLIGRPHAHYADLARRVQSFVADDLVQVRAWAAGTPDGVSSAAEPREWWTISVGPGCTLCDICVQVCRPGALQRVRQENVTILYYEAALCDGCAACQRWCPEETMHVDRVDECPAGGELARSAQIGCPGCGKPYAPASMVNNVQARLGEVSETMLQRLIMCPDCKATSIRFERRKA
jgi:TorA maturation chaperone TorD/Fe-S-cluster-containing hydrogenase component 2